MKIHRKSAPILLLSVLTLTAAIPHAAAQAPVVESLPATNTINDSATCNGMVNPTGTATAAF